MNGRPSTGASGLAVSGRTVRSRVPRPPANSTPVMGLETPRVPNLQSPVFERAVGHHAARAFQRLSHVILLMGFTVKQQVAAAARAHQLATQGACLASDFVKLVGLAAFGDVRIHALLVDEAFMQQLAKK